MKKKIIAFLSIMVLAISIGVAYSRTPMKLYIDTHDKRDGSFPASITPAQLNKFYAKYAKACADSGVIIIRTYVSLKDGRAYCINMAPSVAAVKKAHKRAGLPYNGISEVFGVAPSDLLLNE
jgi:hypothetical protein